MNTSLSHFFPSFPSTELLANLGSFLRLGVVFVPGSRRCLDSRCDCGVWWAWHGCGGDLPALWGCRSARRRRVEACERGGEWRGSRTERGEPKGSSVLPMNARCCRASSPSTRPSLPCHTPAAENHARATPRRHRRLAAGKDTTRREGMEEPKGPGPDVKRKPPLLALAGPYGSPSSRPQGC